jgi:hypothetical protein
MPRGDSFTTGDHAAAAAADASCCEASRPQQSVALEELQASMHRLHLHCAVLGGARCRLRQTHQLPTAAATNT